MVQQRTLEDVVEIQTLRYTPEGGWSAPPPALDSPRTLVLVFGSPGYLHHPGPLAELAAAYPSSRIAGCSTAGEIFGTARTGLSCFP